MPALFPGAAAGTKPAIGVIHLAPLPGSPRFARGAASVEAIVDAAVASARALAAAGFDGAIVENFGDAPFFPERVPPETVAALAIATAAVVRAVAPLPVGVNCLRNDARAAIGIAAAAGARLIRVNVHVGAAVADQGLIVGRAHETLRARAALAPEVAIFADIDVKHARPLAGAAAPPLEIQAEEAVARGLADALVVTGFTTGRPPAFDALDAARRGARGAPVFAGSGVTPEIAAEIARHADGVIVGTALEREGRIEPARAAAFMAAWRSACDREP